MRGGYEFGQSRNNTPAEALPVAKDQLTGMYAGYIALGGDNTCEAHVLGTMFNINAVHTPGSAVLTEDALNNVCGPEPSHAQLAFEATAKFHDIAKQRRRVNDIVNHIKYSGNEKLTAMTVPVFAVDVPLIFGLYWLNSRKQRKAKCNSVW